MSDIGYYVDEVNEAYNGLKKKYDDTGLALSLLNIAVAARNSDHLNTNVSGNVIVKAEDEKEMLKNN